MNELACRVNRVVGVATCSYFRYRLLPGAKGPTYFLSANVVRNLFARFFGLPIDIVRARYFAVNSKGYIFRIRPRDMGAC